ncbi:sensor domain-containing diguanylate cyclase [Candidatus Pantoea soli]|uniref:diguanylate cyclase n=1 Tax=Candidatus Pantoea soli TaxID=3098669 RepID=A0A518XI54_9GAMM|nr:sensor domain-containing diguanylate cyclase [Pantoea soli]QDY43849.1 diguanylate cyclase [Pantoea soli]
MSKLKSLEHEGVLRGSLIKSITLSWLLLVIAVAGISAWTLHEDWKQTVSQTEETAINLSLSQARQAEDTFLQTELSLRELQRSVEAQLSSGIDAQSLSQTMRELQRRLPQLHGLFYYDAQGKWIATSALKTPAGINNSDREYFTFQRNNLRNSIHPGPVIRSRTTGELVIPVSLRISDAYQGFQGVLLATIRVDYFRRFYSYYEMGPHDVLVLMLADSSVLYARPMPDSFIGRNLSASPLFSEMLAKNSRGSGQWTSALDGKNRLFGFASSDRYPLIVAAGYDTRDLFLRWAKGRVQDVLLSVALLGIIVALGLYVMRQARRSLRYQCELTSLRDELKQANNTLNRMAHRDALTNLANRREFDRYLNETLATARQQGTPVALVMIDVDYFKRFNDTYGHVAGDACLQRIAWALNALPMRSSDLVARYGGEEFALILPGADTQHAGQIAARAAAAVRALHIPHQTSGLPAQQVTLSAGYAAWVPVAAHHTAQALIAQADRALYLAKQSGRDRVQAGQETA